ncbi:hypothetical protein R4I06_04050 [Anaplasma bovis]
MERDFTKHGSDGDFLLEEEGSRSCLLHIIIRIDEYISHVIVCALIGGGGCFDAFTLDNAR